MPATDLIGREHNAHLDWLLNTWMSGSSPVCFLEGFPGTGKTTIARALLSRAVAAKLTAVMITAPETEGDPTDDLLLDLAMELNSAGRTELARAIDNNRSLLDVLSTIVNDPVLIIIDEFQHSMQGARAITTGGFAKTLSTLANRKWLKGRILLLTNRLVERARWSEPYTIRTLSGMSSDDGVELLEYFAQEGGRIDEISADRRGDVVKWLGGNPRAIQLLVRSLSYESLDDLIGIQPELWETRDREVSIELVEKLERALLERTLDQLSNDYLRQLYRLSVYRKPFKREAIERLFDDSSIYARFREEMIDRFLMEQHKGWFNLHPIVREIGLQKLAQSLSDLKQAHSIVATYYTRHFEAKQIVGWGTLGGHFVEARYHLVKADKADDLKEIASRFQSYIFSTLHGTPPIPSNAEELDERIAVLSALLETPGPRNLEYHLARLFKVRNQRNDLRRALDHARRATSNSDYAPAWQLCSEILSQMNRSEEAIEVLQEGIAKVPVDKNVFALYQAAGELLAQTGKVDEAITLLQEGIAIVPVDKNVFALYQAAGELLAQTGKVDEAITLLQEGIAKVPVDKSVFALYQAAGELLAQTGKVDEAITLLQEGIAKVPVDKSVVDLYQAAGELLAQMGKVDEAITLLQEGIAKVPVDKSAFALYQATGVLLAQMGKVDEAITLLKNGIANVPVDKSRYKLVEAVLSMLLARHNNQAIDDLLAGTGTLIIEPPLLALGKIYKLMIPREWEGAAQLARQEGPKFPRYRPIMQTEAFCWLCANNLRAAEEALRQITVQKKPFEPIYWLRTWVALKQSDLGAARDSLSIYMNRPIHEHELNEQFLLGLWDTAPSIGGRSDLAYYFPILPASLTGLPHDVVRMPYGPGVISQLSSRQEQPESSPVTLPAPPLSGPSANELQSWPVWMDEAENPSGNKPRLDVGIVIALEEEFRELAPQIQIRASYNSDIKQYFYLFERSSTNAALVPYRCVVTFMGAMGPTDAGIVGDRLIAQFNPATIVSIGIAGSMDKDILVGDIVVADQTDEYLATSRAIETTDKQNWNIQFSGNVYKSDPGYVVHAANLKYAYAEIAQSWQSSSKRKLLEWVGSVSTDELIRQRLIGHVPEVRTGHIASGPIVGDANQFVQWLKEGRDRKFLALEMESVGVLNAAHKRAVSSLIIRGISDYSDERKKTLDELGSGALRRYAMNNALALLWVLMDLGLINRTSLQTGAMTT